MPDASALPADLKALAKHQAMEIRHERFRADVDALAQAIAASTPGARGWRWRTAAIALVIVAAAGSLYVKSGAVVHINSPSANNGDGLAWTAWLDQAAYQREFDRQVNKLWYPSMIEVQLQGEVVKYRAVFEPFPWSTFEFYSRHSVNDEEFAMFDGEMTKAGYKRVFQQRIMVHSRPFNQGTWTKP